MRCFRAIFLALYVFTFYFFSSSLVQADDAPDYLASWGTSGTGNGQFDTPKWIRVDSNNNVYVFDYGNSRIQKFDSNGTFLTKWGSSGTGNGQFTTPLGFVIDSANNIYVLDSGRIQKFDSSGTHLQTWTNYFTDPNASPTPTPTPPCVENWCLDPEDFACVPVFCDDIPPDVGGGVVGIGMPQPGPMGIGIDSNDIIYLTFVRYGAELPHGSESSVYKINTSGILQSQIVLGQGTGNFAWYPVEIAVDPNGNLYTLHYADYEQGQEYACGIRKFNSSGAFVSQNGACPQDMAGIGGSGGGVSYPQPGSFFGAFGAPPSGIFIKGNSLFVTHSANYQVVKYNYTNSSFATVGGFAYWGDTPWSDPATIVGEFDSPYGVAVDNNDNVYVTDKNLNRVQKFGTAILDHSVNYTVIGSQVGWAGSIFGNAIQSVAHGGDAMQVRAQPVRGYAFLKWSDNSTQNPRQDTNVQADIAVQAEFIYSYAVTEPKYGMPMAVERGFLAPSGADLTNTSGATFNVSFEFIADNAKVTVPFETVVRDTSGAVFDLSNFTISDEVSDITTQQPYSVGVIQFGIPDHKLSFSQPVTVNIPVDAQFNGQTLPVVYRFEGESDWHTETNCKISDGRCSFATNHATSFAVLKLASTVSCTNLAPAKVSDLFQIEVKGTSAKLFFSPVHDGDRYVISYSTKPDAEEHNVVAMLAKEGVQNFTINHLRPNATYYFKVRGQNDCAPGNWSNIMPAKTGSAKMSDLFTYYRSAKAKFTNVLKKVNGEAAVTIQPSKAAELTEKQELSISSVQDRGTIKKEAKQPQKKCYLFGKWLCF